LFGGQHLALEDIGAWIGFFLPILRFESSRDLVVRQSPDIQSCNLGVPTSNLMLSHPQSSVSRSNFSGSAGPSQNPRRQRVWGRSSHLACHTRGRRWVRPRVIDRLRRVWAVERPTNDKRETSKVALHEESWPALMRADQTETKTRMDHCLSS
jgi:hypothetical protein